MATHWLGQLSHRVLMSAVAAQGVMDVKEHPIHNILADFAISLENLASTLKKLQKDLEDQSPLSPIRFQHLKIEIVMTSVEQLVMALKTQSQLSSLLSYPLLLTKLHSCREDLSGDLESIIRAVDCSRVVKQHVCQTQPQLKPKVGPKEQAVLDSLDMIIQGSTPQKCKELVEQVAEYMSVAQSGSIC